MFDDLITYSAPPSNRVGKCDGDQAHTTTWPMKI